jgi:alpha-beta hydrolase superfamily lysophospholipase
LISSQRLLREQQAGAFVKIGTARAQDVGRPAEGLRHQVAHRDLRPAFAKAAWLSVTPEFNPFKYNSFPVNGARQSVRLADALQAQIVQYAREGKLVQLPPILTFQSVVDFTVSTNAIVSALYARLPSNRSELVLFDVNRGVKFGQLLRSSADIALSRILPAGPQKYRTAIITNTDAGTSEVSERVIEAETATENSHPLGLSFPPGVYSLSHVALPFPINDSLCHRGRVL